MNLSETAELKIKCLKIVIDEHKGENRPSEFLIKKANDLFEWVTRY